MSGGISRQRNGYIDEAHPLSNQQRVFVKVPPRVFVSFQAHHRGSTEIHNSDPSLQIVQITLHIVWSWFCICWSHFEFVICSCNHVTNTLRNEINGRMLIFHFPHGKVKFQRSCFGKGRGSLLMWCSSTTCGKEDMKSKQRSDKKGNQIQLMVETRTNKQSLSNIFWQEVGC